jgi:hypothetical protein
MYSETMLGVHTFEKLGIKKIFDMRSDPEMLKYGSAQLPTINGVDIVPTPVFKNEDYSPEQMAKCVVRNVADPVSVLPTDDVLHDYRRYKLYASGKTEVC